MKSCLAAIDMGTNSFHLIIVQVNNDGTFKIIDREREVIRLGSHKGTGFELISEGEIEKAIDILKDFKKIARFYGADIRAIATSAVRESKNKEEFLDRVFDATEISVEAINGNYEASLIYLGVQNALHLKNKRVLCVDIGGGSTEFLLGEKGSAEFAESLKLGAVRLSKMFFPEYILSDASVSSCYKYIKDKISSNKNLHPNHRFDFAVGTSGTVTAAAAIIYYKRYKKFASSLNDFSFTSDELNELITEVLKCKSPVDRLFIEGMEVKRADIIPAGLLILKAVFDTFRLSDMKVSENALREGIIIETIRQKHHEEAAMSV